MRLELEHYRGRGLKRTHQEEGWSRYAIYMECLGTHLVFLCVKLTVFGRTYQKNLNSDGQ